MRKQTVLSILIPAIVAIIPAVFTYCQSMYEIRQKYKQTHIEAEAGYASLVNAVKELQSATKLQHDQIIQIQAYLQAMETFITRQASTTRSSFGSGVRALSAPDHGVALARIRPAAPPAPDLTEPAADLDQAAKAKH